MDGDTKVLRSGNRLSVSAVYGQGLYMSPLSTGFSIQATRSIVLGCSACSSLCCFPPCITNSMSALRFLKRFAFCYRQQPALQICHASRHKALPQVQLVFFQLYNTWR
ncbi:hypothetical protein ABBQ38_014056 [Trebouxia sp. C0009 RCD-2024]